MTNKQLRQIAEQAEQSGKGWPDAICPNCGEPEWDGDEHIEVYDATESASGEYIGCCGHCDFTGRWAEDFRRHEVQEVGTLF